MAKHTPGPWFAHATAHERLWDVNVAARPYAPAVAACHFNEFVNGMTLAQVEANARLIAAAPDMLAALKAYHTLHEASETRFPSPAGTPARIAFELGTAAIAKAEDRS